MFSRSIIDDSRVTLKHEVSFMIIIYDSYMTIIMSVIVVTMFSRSITDDSESITDDSESMSDDSIVNLQRVASFMIIIYDTIYFYTIIIFLYYNCHMTITISDACTKNVL
jgi:hypothetical protein